VLRAHIFITWLDIQEELRLELFELQELLVLSFTYFKSTTWQIGVLCLRVRFSLFILLDLVFDIIMNGHHVVYIIICRFTFIFALGVDLTLLNCNLEVLLHG
jgi:hypothetical protein